MQQIRIQRLTEAEDFPEPLRASQAAAAWDLHAAIDEPIVVPPHGEILIGTGYAWEIPEGYLGLLLPRSGRGFKEGLVLGNIAGLIDPDYRGEVKAAVWNRRAPAYEVDRYRTFVAAQDQGQHTITIHPRERFCQLVVLPAPVFELALADSLSDTARGDGGFGRSGK